VKVLTTSTGVRIENRDFCLSSLLRRERVLSDRQRPGAHRRLARYYFASPQSEISARSDLDAALHRLQVFKGSLSSGARLLKALQTYEEMLQLFRLHEGYLHFRCALNRKDAACDANEKLEADVTAKSSFLQPAVLALSASRLRSFYASAPRLKSYRFAIEDMRRDGEHVLPENQQAQLDRFQPEIADWQYDLYDQIIAGIPFGKVQTPTGALDVIRQRNLLAANSDSAIREEAFKKRYNGFASQRDLLAFTLIHTVKAQNALAIAHHYKDAPSRKYESMYLDPGETKALMVAMGQQGDVARAYEKVLSHDFEEAFKKPMRAWDLSAPQPGFVAPVTSLAEAPGIFHDAFAGLGAGYQSAFDALLDPGNARADVLPGGAPNRYQGGFSIGFTGATSMLFFGRYDGTFKDLSVIAHEGGHAVHRGLMSAQHVQPLYAHGPSFLFESFAAFNELVLADYMAAHAADPRLRRYYLEEWMGIKGLDAFYGAQDALLEQQIYDGVSAGKIRGADDLDKITITVDSQFSTFPATTPELRNRWAAVSLMYEDPLYDVNYVYGGLLALKYYQLYGADRENFVPRYIALLKNGFDAPPATLLKRFLNIDLLDPALLADDVKLLNQRLSELQTAP
jgi:oligoendopeptidase F